METDNKYEEVSKYFPLQEWNNFPEYEKNRFHNLLINYNKMCELGFSPKKPDFMLSGINKTRIMKLQKESDEEWTPNKVKRPKWNPPRKLAGEVPADEQKIEEQAFVQFTAADISRSQEIYQCLLQRIAELRKKLGFEDIPEYRLPTQHRYPRRQIERKDYREREVPDDDDYIYCDECEREWEGDCPEHGALVNVPDTKVPDTVNGPDRAEKTVPKELCIAQSSIHNAGKGVWTRVLLQKGLRFGPYEGVKVNSPNGEGYCWQIKRNQRISHYVDAWDSSRSNWMRYVNCARHEEEQNLIAFQYKGEMYYRTFRAIRAHVELLVWYGDDFGRELGIDKENYHKPLPAGLKSNIFPCKSCNVTYSSPVYLHNHFKYCCMRTSTPGETFGAPTTNNLVANERFCPWQCINCKSFGNTKWVSFKNSGLKMINNENKSDESGNHQLVNTDKKFVERMKNDYLSCTDVDDKSRGIPSEYVKTFSLKESLNTIALKCVRDAPITCGGSKESVDTFMKRKNITKCTFIYPEEQNFNSDYRSYACLGSPIVGTQLHECSLPWNTFHLNFTLHTQRNTHLCKIYNNSFLNYDDLQLLETRSTPSLSVISPLQSSTILESTLLNKFNESRKLLPVKTGIRNCENINLACIKKLHERQSSHFSNKSFNTNEWSYASNQNNKICAFVSKSHMKGRQRALDAGQSISKTCLPMVKRLLYSANGFTQRTESQSHEKLDTIDQLYASESIKEMVEGNINLRQIAKKEERNVCRRVVTSKLHETLLSGELLSKSKEYRKTPAKAGKSNLETNARNRSGEYCRKNNEENLRKNNSNLVQHRVHSGEKPYECTMCNKRFNHKNSLVLHHRVHLGEKPYECTMCNKRFSQKSILVQHHRVHSGEKPYECTMCNKRFNHKNSLVQHHRVHSGEKPYECTMCNKRFNHKNSLVQHHRVHSGEKPYECTMCNKRFNQKSDLVQHHRVHSGEKPYECTMCNKRFNKKSNLVQHHRVHSDEKPYECTMCNKRFNHKNSLVRHHRVHSGEKPYECTMCNKRFNHKTSLVQHHRVHSGEKPYECTMWNKTFSHKSSLVRHL